MQRQEQRQFTWSQMVEVDATTVLNGKKNAALTTATKSHVVQLRI